jgi:hypothetical protein
MPDSTTSAFGELNGFQAALQNEGNLSLYITTYGQFLARLTKVGLYRLRLAAVEEHLSRIGLLAVSPDAVLISFPTGDQLPPTWGGTQPRNGEFMSLGPDHRVHVRSHVVHCAKPDVPHWTHAQVLRAPCAQEANGNAERRGKPLSRAAPGPIGSQADF